MSRGAKWAAYRVLRRLLARLGLDVIPHDYNSPVPDFARLTEDFWDSPVATLGLTLDPAASFDYLERELARYVPEFNPPIHPQPQASQFFLDNPVFASVDAEVLYAMVRRHRPARIVELGSGFSSKVIASACARNAADGTVAAYRAFDPLSWLAKAEPEMPIVEVSACDVPLSVFEALDRDDVLFADTSHTVKVGSEVNYIVLDVLPRLRPGVLVHFHDVFLPWHYPREWVENEQWYWAEQYLLQAALAFSPRYEILFSSNLVVRSDPGRVWRSIPRYQPTHQPASLWVRISDDARKQGS